MQQKKIIIFGGQGFIGINLSKFLIKKKNYKIILVGNKSPNKKNYFTKHELKKIQFFECNIFNFKYLKKINYFNSIIIFAALSGKLRTKFFIKKIKTLFSFLSKKNIKKIVLLSSISVYGDYKLSISEKTKTKPKSVYASNCLSAEKILKSQLKNFDIIILRIANAFGVYRDKPGTIEKLILNQKIGKKFILHKQKLIRSYIFINDLVKIVQLIINKKIKLEIFNVSNPKYIFTMEDILNYLKKLLKSELRINKKILPYDIKNSICRSNKLKKMLGYKFNNNFLKELKIILNF